MKVYQDFYSYAGGVYKHSDLDLYREHGYHSVRIIGWGEEYTSSGYQKYWVSICPINIFRLEKCGPFGF